MKTLVSILTFATLGSASLNVYAAENVNARAKAIISQHLGVKRKQITDSSTIRNDLGANKYAFIELVMAFEEEFAMKISDSQALYLETVKDFVDFAEQNARR